MTNILINLFSKTLEENDFVKFSKYFDGKYEIYNYYFDINEMFPDIVEAIINTLIEETALNSQHSKIVLQTNVVDLGHFSAKFYSELLDAVVIVPLNVEFLINNFLENFDFMIPIMKSNFEEWRLETIYVYDIVESDIKYLIFLNNYKLFNEIQSFKDFETSFKEKSRYNLIFNLESGNINSNLKKRKDLKVCCLEEKIADSIQYLYVNNLFGFYELIHLVIKLDIESRIKGKYLLDILNFVNQRGCLGKVSTFIQDYLCLDGLTLEEFADLNFILMQTGDQNGLERQYQFLKKEFHNLNPIQVYALITNSLFYQSKLGQKEYKNLFIDRMIMLEKVNDYIRPLIKIREKKRRGNKIAIVTGQLLSLNHAPTKWALDYANTLKKHYPELQIKIFVEDWASYSPAELTWEYIFGSIPSSSCKEIHRAYLHSQIKVYYSDSAKSRITRIQDEIEAISEFKPFLIYKMGSKYNPAVDLLYPYYPIVSHTMGGAEDSNYVDIFTGGYTKEDIDNMYKQQGINNYTYIPHTVGIETPKTVTLKERQQYSLNEKDFVLVTVGSRLEVEVTQEFIEQIISILMKNPTVKWVIVGTDKLSLINQNYADYIKNKQIIYVPYEKELFDFYKICDIYVNPIRKAGGNSAAMAMKAKLPIVTTNPNSDVGAFAGKENCIKKDEFFHEINKLINSIYYYKEKSSVMYEQIETKYSFEQTVKDLIKIFDLAVEKFKFRQDIL